MAGPPPFQHNGFKKNGVAPTPTLRMRREWLEENLFSDRQARSRYSPLNAGAFTVHRLRRSFIKEGWPRQWRSIALTPFAFLTTKNLRPYGLEVFCICCNKWWRWRETLVDVWFNILTTNHLRYLPTRNNNFKLSRCLVLFSFIYQCFGM